MSRVLRSRIAVVTSYLLVVAGLLLPAPTPAAADFITNTGDGYGVVVDGRGRCVVAWANVAVASNVKCQEGAPLWRSDEGKWYSMQSGSWTAVAFAAQSLTAPVITAIATDPTTTVGVGAVAGTGVAVTENGDGAVHKTTFTFTAHSQATTDAGAAGAHGSTKIYDFPQGYILHLGTTCNLTTLAGSGGIADGAAAVFALGSVTTATDNATLGTTEADFIASYAGTLTAGAGVFTKTGTGTFTAFDGHTTALDLYLNAAVPDADHTASADTIAYTGTCTMTWVNQGDF